MGDLLTPREVAERLRLSMDTVYELIRDGKLPARNVGAGSSPRWRIHSEDVDAYLTRPSSGPAAPGPGPERSDGEAPGARTRAAAPPRVARTKGQFMNPDERSGPGRPSPRPRA